MGDGRLDGDCEYRLLKLELFDWHRLRQSLYPWMSDDVSPFLYSLLVCTQTDCRAGPGAQLPETMIKFVQGEAQLIFGSGYRRAKNSKPILAVQARSAGHAL